MPGGNDTSAFSATQVFSKIGTVTDEATVYVRYRNVIIIAVMEGPRPVLRRQEVRPGVMSDLTAAAQTVASRWPARLSDGRAARQRAGRNCAAKLALTAIALSRGSLRSLVVLLLGLDTATPAVTVALHDGGQPLAQLVTVDAHRHAELLAPSIAKVIADAGVRSGT